MKTSCPSSGQPQPIRANVAVNSLNKARVTLLFVAALAMLCVYSKAHAQAVSAEPSQLARADTGALPSEPAASEGAFWQGAIVGGGVITIAIFVCGLIFRERGLYATLLPGSARPKNSVQQNSLHERQDLFDLFVNDTSYRFSHDLTVSQVMSAHPITVPPNMRASRVVETMKQHHVRHLLVCGRGKKLLGIISNRDLAKSHAKTAAELMTRDPVTTAPSQCINPAISQMIDRQILFLPVTAGDTVVGVLTSTDLLIALQCVVRALQCHSEHDGPTSGSEAEAEPIPEPIAT